ncbi:hypothetical protein AB4571_03960 [Vibrio breoganii]|uniref:hypothetical protein n=1 Tax=Vibrio breoganii TaxID=553239 RepID=UPI000C8448DD|nr:hypothetical protein [Vibrio breoganii]PML10946.1 hypothetical protein BCT84_03535 [Vibrio breoganii]
MQMYSEFEIQITIGLSDSIAVTSLQEREVNELREVVENGFDLAVRNDIEMCGVADWWNFLPLEHPISEGTYLVKGIGFFTEDEACYHKLEIDPVTQV